MCTPCHPAHHVIRHLLRWGRRLHVSGERAAPVTHAQVGEKVLHEDVLLDGEPLDPPFPMAVMLHKPVGYVVTSPDDEKVGPWGGWAVAGACRGRGEVWGQVQGGCQESVGVMRATGQVGECVSIGLAGFKRQSTHGITCSCSNAASDCGPQGL